MKVSLKGSATSVAGGKFAVLGEDGVQLASVEAVETRTRRTADSYYDRHRIAKGDMFDSSVKYIVEGDIEGVCKALASNLPQPFKEAGFGRSWFKQDPSDFYACFDFLRTICSQRGWFGNTPKPLIKKIKSAWKRGVELQV